MFSVSWKLTYFLMPAMPAMPATFRCEALAIFVKSLPGWNGIRFLIFSEIQG